MLQKLSTDSDSAHIRIDEQRFHVSPIDQHEAMGFVVLIDRNSHWRMGKKAAHLVINGFSVLSTEKVMGGIDGATPKVNESLTISRK